MADSSAFSNVSFSFKKKDQVTINKSCIAEDNSITTETDFIKSVEDKNVQSLRPAAKKNALVIPVKKNSTNWLDGISDLDKQAAEELIRGAKSDSDEIEKPEAVINSANRTESDAAQESTLDDYEQVPIEEYGLAMLRGMGWKPGAAIGARCKEAARLVEVNVRPKGLGLGAEAILKKKVHAVIDQKGQEENLELKVGACVCLLDGQYKGMYGKVEGFDEDNGRTLVRLTLTKTVVTVSDVFVRVVNKTEYKESSKVLNKERYDDYKRQHDISDDKTTNEEAKNSKSEKTEKPKKDEPSSRSSSKQNESSRKKAKRKRSSSSSEEDDRPNMSLIANVRVRIVDKKFRGGKYMEEKVIVEDVLSPNSCLCRTNDGKILDDVRTSMLETVIPRSEGALVIVLEGKFRGIVGRVLEKNKRKMTAHVEFLNDKAVHKFDFNQITEYLGHHDE